MTVPPAAPSTSSAPDVVLGRTEPRLWTPPLRSLDPTTSYGFDVVDFARDVLGEPLDPWQEWLVIHLGELLPDGRPRFRTALAIVARQQGKSFLIRTLILFWMFVEQVPLTLATSTDRGYAKKAWRQAVDAAKANPLLAAELPARPTVEQLGEEEFRTIHGTKYVFAATNRRAGRSLTVHRLVVDEIREHANFDAWTAATFAMNAVSHAQAITVSNMGDSSAVVLDSLRQPALDYIETGEGDPRLGIFEWSAPRGSAPTDLHALAHANPGLGDRVDADSLLGAARRAQAAGGEELATFRIEVMCMPVPTLDPAIDPDQWDAGGTDTPVDLARHRDRVALCLDVSLAGDHAAVLAAAELDGIVHVEVAAAWSGHGCTKALRAELPALVKRIRPRVLGWLPQGPAASVTAALAARRGQQPWPPRGVVLQELTAETPALCMGLADAVFGGDVQHPKDPMLTAHVEAAQKLYRGDRWVYARKGAGPINGAYALAGAVHLARTLPAPLAPLVAL